MLELDEPFVALCAARLLSRRRCWDLTWFTCDRRRHREPLANALTTYDINDLSLTPTGGNDNGAPGETKHGHVSDDGAGDAVSRSSRRATEEAPHASAGLIHLVEAARARARSPPAYFVSGQRADQPSPPSRRSRRARPHISRR